MKKPRIDWKLLERYTRGEATLHERYVVDQWLEEAGSEDIRWFFKELRDDPEMEQFKADALTRIHREIALPPEQLVAKMDALAHRIKQRFLPVQTPVAAKGKSRGILKAAAIIALVLGGSLGVWQTGRVMGERHAEAVLGTVTAPVGRPPVSVPLPDGSQVILSPGSTLRYATAFGTDRREVRLEGEAYFDVEHDAGRPFVVRAGDLVAEDLGTEFVVRAYPEDRYGRVIVREGLVGIGGTRVAPGQLGRLDANGTPVVEPADTASWFAWTRGRLNLDGMLLRDAQPKLSRWYNLEFRLAEPSLGSIELSGDFPEQLNDDALEKVAIVLGLSVTRKGRVVTFHAGPASPS
jgi:transmembrane sensor